jgi:hypothetical protein
MTDPRDETATFLTIAEAAEEEEMIAQAEKIEMSSLSRLEQAQKPEVHLRKSASRRQILQMSCPYLNDEED